MDLLVDLHSAGVVLTYFDGGLDVGQLIGGRNMWSGLSGR